MIIAPTHPPSPLAQTSVFKHLDSLNRIIVHNLPLNQLSFQRDLNKRYINNTELEGIFWSKIELIEKLEYYLH